VTSTPASLPSVLRGQGSPVVFLHGYPLDHSIWKAQLEALSRRHRVVLIDFPGYGLAKERLPPTNLSGFSEAVHTTLDALGATPATLFGHSFGGYVALQLYRDHPDQFRALGLVSTRSEADSPEARATRLATIERLRTPGEMLDLEGTVRALVSDSTWRQQAAVVERVRKIVRSAAPRAIIPTLQAIMDRPDLTPVLSTISVPTLVLWGDDDRLIPKKQTQSMADRISGARGVEIPKAGHLSPMEAPQAFNATILDFLETLG
jgi:3-oxoadipate enol-lactonase